MRETNLRLALTATIPQAAKRPGLKELLMNRGPRFEDIVPKRGQLRRREPKDV